MGNGRGCSRFVFGRDDTLVSGGTGGGPLDLSLRPGRDDPTVSGHGGMGVAPINLSMGRDGATVSGGLGVACLNWSLRRENATITGGVGVAPFDLSLGGDATVSGGMGAGEEVGEEERRVSNTSWDGQGEDRMRALSIEKLHAIAKSEENLAVVLVRNFFLKGAAC